MDSAPYLQAEDKLDYERILEELLHNEQVRSALRRAPTGPNAEQLHTRAMRDFATVAGTAAVEYSYFVELREQARRTAPVPDWERLGGDDPAQWQEPESPLIAAERAGLVPLVAVLLPILSGFSALLLLLLGYGLRADGQKLGQPLVTAGLVAAVICVAAIAADIIGLLLTAARDSSSPPQGRNPELYAELAKAREAWHGALRDRGLLPYLLAQLGTTPRPPRPRPAGVSLVRTRPRLGFSSPGFTSPGSERISNQRGEEVEPEEGGETHFTSPGFTSPGPEGITNERGEEFESDDDGESHFTSPGYSSPTFEVVRDPFEHPTHPSVTAPAPTVPPSRTQAPDSNGSGSGLASGSRSGNRFLPNADDAEEEQPS